MPLSTITSQASSFASPPSSHQPINPLRSNPHTSLRAVKHDRTSEWALALTPLPPADSSEDFEFSDEARDRSRFSETIVRLTTSPDIVRDGQCGGRPRSGERVGSSSSRGGLIMGRVESGGASQASLRSGKEGKSRIRMLTDEERMRKEIEMLEVPVERIGRKRPGGWRWWFGID